MKQQTIKTPSGLENKLITLDFLKDIFKTKNNPEITNLYNLYWEEFRNYIKKSFTVDDNIIYDVYQESFIALYENIKEGKISQLTGTLKTYLFGIGRNTMNKYYQKNKRMTFSETLDIYSFEDDQSDVEWLKKKHIIWKTVNEMEEPCATILSLCYWERKSMSEIAEKMNYLNAQNARNKKSKCQKMLIDKLLKIFELNK